MPLEIFHDIEQGSDEWFQVRLGIPTASMFATLLGIKKDAREKKTRDTYMKKLAGEVISGRPMENYSNDFMERGKALEAEARAHYEFDCIEPLTRVGFMRDGMAGCSPDALVGDAGVLEIKTKGAHLLIDCWQADEFPPEHKAQCQGALLISGREWVDLFVYSPGMPPFKKRAHRDETYIRELGHAINQFNDDLAALVEWMRQRKAA